MVRPRIYDEPRVATAVRLPVSLRDDLRVAARERAVSVNLLVTRAISDYLRRLPPPGIAGPGDHASHRPIAEGGST